MRALGWAGAVGTVLWATCALAADAVAAPAAEGIAAPPETAIEEPAGPLSLEDALALALVQSPALGEFSAAVRAGEARTLQARKLPNPELDMRAYWLSDEPQGGGPVEEEGRLRVVLLQPIELGGRRGSRVDLARVEQDVAGWEYAIARDAVVGEAAGQFAAVVGAQRRVWAAQQLVEFVEAIRGRVEPLVKDGTLRALDAHVVNGEAGRARIALQSAESDLGTARFKLAAVWGAQAPRFTEAVGDFGPPAALPDLAAVLELLASSPTVALHAAEVARGQAALDVARAEKFPEMAVGAGVRWAEDSSEEDYLFDFEISLPLFDRRQGEVRAAQHEVAGAQSARRAAEAEAAGGAAELYHALAEARVRSVALAEAVVPAARAAFEAQRVGFERGAVDLDDLLDARRDLARAESDHAEALVDYHQARAALEALVGQPLPLPGAVPPRSGLPGSEPAVGSDPGR
jgi:cobalt-zinc-cadmium efflux system outer membrane protein